MDPRSDIDLHEMVNIAALLRLGGLVETEAQGWSAISHGSVRVERWTIGISEATMPRWVLRGVTITKADRSMHISEDGSCILHRGELQLA